MCVLLSGLCVLSGIESKSRVLILLLNCYG